MHSGKVTTVTTKHVSNSAIKFDILAMHDAFFLRGYYNMVRVSQQFKELSPGEELSKSQGVQTSPCRGLMVTRPGGLVRNYLSPG